MTLRLFKRQRTTQAAEQPALTSAQPPIAVSNAEREVHVGRQHPAQEDDDDDGGDPFILKADGGVPDLKTSSSPSSSSSWRADVAASNSVARTLVTGLSWVDRLLSLFIILAMIIGVVIGLFVKDIDDKLSKAKLKGVSAPLAIGLIVMMTPILTKVQYERLPGLLRTTKLWSQISLSLVLNWFAGPMLMLGLAWATIPEKHLAAYRTGVILLAPCRCIAMVMIWNNIARGDSNVCALLVIINSVLQIILYAPIAVLFINVISDGDKFGMQYANCAISVLLYLGIPILAGISIRFFFLTLTSRHFFQHRFLPLFSPLSLLSLLFVIIIIFASQAHAILDQIGAVFRTVVPLVLYFAVMWGGTFALVWKLSRRYGAKTWGYQMAVVQAFTAGSNNFELAIAVAVSVYGPNSRQALAATIGPLVEVPVLLLLSWVALILGRRMKWDIEPVSDVQEKINAALPPCGAGAGAGECEEKGGKGKRKGEREAGRDELKGAKKEEDDDDEQDVIKAEKASAPAAASPSSPATTDLEKQQ
ncbi:arsenicals resistance [Tilletia horrida]|nr:arsenicals resistance [Tilletia horrida]